LFPKYLFKISVQVDSRYSSTAAAALIGGLTMTSLMTTLGPEGGSKTDNQQLNTEHD